MPVSSLRRTLTACVCSAAVALTVSAAGAQSAAMPPGNVSGVVTAKGANGEIIKGANVMVELWTTDAATEAKRDSACAMWLADKTIWLQAKGEAESPSGINWTGTAVGNDLALLNSLLALRRDTVHTDANGEFRFASVPFGAYTIEAEMYANNKFLQWSRDAAVIPNTTTHVQLDQSALAENQYCQVSAGNSGGDQAYNASDLDKPLTLLSGAPAPSTAANSSATVTIDFVVDANGIPDPQTVQVKHSTGAAVSVDDARNIVSKLRYSQPTVKGAAVRANVEYVAPSPSSGSGRRRR